MVFNPHQLTPEEQAVESATRRGFRLWFLDWPLAAFACGALSLLPFVGGFFGVVAKLLFLAWLVHFAWTRRDAIKRWWLETRGKLRKPRNAIEAASHERALDEWTIAGKSMVKAALLDTAEGDLHVSAQLVASRDEIARLR